MVQVDFKANMSGLSQKRNNAVNHSQSCSKQNRYGTLECVMFDEDVTTS